MLKLREIKEFYADDGNSPLKNHYFIDSKNRKHGESRFYSRDGQLISVRYFKSGIPNGNVTIFSHRDTYGSILINGFWSYKMGIRFGQHKF